MEIKHPATAGTLESSDIQITLSPATSGVSHSTAKQCRKTVWSSNSISH